MTSGLIFSVLSIVLGVLVAVFTDISIKIIVILLGATSVIKGVADFFTVRRLVDDSFFRRSVSVKCLLSIILGAVAVILPMNFWHAAESIIHVLLIVIGIYLVASALFELIVIVSKLDMAELPTRPYRIEAVVSLLIAILLFVIAFIGMTNIVRIMGIVLALCGLIYGLYAWRKRPIVIEPDSVKDAGIEDDIDITPDVSPEVIPDDESKEDSAADESK